MRRRLKAKGNRISTPTISISRFIPKGATSFPSSRILIDFRYYNQKMCEVEMIYEKSIAKKFLKILKQIGTCNDGQEMMNVLKDHNSFQIHNSHPYDKLYSTIEREGLQLFELWHKKGTSERFFFSTSGSIFFPVAFRINHL
jgi:hypothetical protein